MSCILSINLFHYQHRFLDEAINFDTMISELEEEYIRTRGESARKKEEAVIRKKVKRLEELKKKEEEDKRAQEKREIVFQEYFQDIDMRKKEKFTQIKKVREQKAEDIDTLKKKNEERLNRKLERIKMQAEREKKKVLDLEKKLQIQQEMNQQALERIQNKKLASAKQKRAVPFAV